MKAWKFFRQFAWDLKGQLALVIITSIVSQIPNYVQTSIFMKYNYSFALLYMIYIYIEKKQEEEETELEVVK